MSNENFIGKVGFINTDGMSFGVKVVDERIRFGHHDLLIQPVSGSGSKWIISPRVHFEEQEQETANAQES